MPQIVKDARVVESRPDRGNDPNILAIHKLEHGLEIGSSRYRAEITVKETKDGAATAHKFYLHRLTK